MIIELLTPLMLATSPLTVPQPTVQPLTYSHSEQATTQVAQKVPTFTTNGTQTFDWQGKPNDADNDTD